VYKIRKKAAEKSRFIRMLPNQPIFDKSYQKQSKSANLTET